MKKLFSFSVIITLLFLSFASGLGSVAPTLPVQNETVATLPVAAEVTASAEAVVEIVTLEQVGPVVQAPKDIPKDLEEKAWALFDAVGAAELLPTDRETTVEYVGWNQVGFEPTTTTITVWDNHGNHYLFQF